MRQILLLDDEPSRAEFVSSLVKERNLSTITVPLDGSNRGVKGVALVHWSMIERAYALLARLRAHTGISMIFYCLCAEMRVREKVLLLPQEMDSLMARILELQLV